MPPAPPPRLQTTGTAPLAPWHQPPSCADVPDAGELLRQAQLKSEAEAKRKDEENKRRVEAEFQLKVRAAWTAHKSEDGQVCNLNISLNGFSNSL